MSRETAPTPQPQDQEKKPDPEQPQEELDDSDFVLVVNRKKPEYRKQRQSENNDETHSQASYNGRRRKYRDRGGTGERSRRKGKENKENVQMKDKEVTKEPVSPQASSPPANPTVRSFSVVVAGGVAAKATQTQEPELLTNLLGMKVKDNTSGSSSIPDTSSLTSEENDSRRDLESVEGSNGSSVVVEYVDAPVPKVNPWGKKIAEKEKEVDKQVDKIDKPAPVEPKLPEKPVEVLVPEMKPVYIREMANGFRPGRGRGSYSGYASAGRKIPSRSSALLKQLGGGEWPTLVEAVGTKGGDEDQVDSHAVGEKEKVKPTQSPPPAQPPSSPSPEPQPQQQPETSSSDNDEESGGKRRGSKVKWLPVDMSSQTEAPVQQQQENKKSGKWKPKGGGSHYYERGGYNRARGKENVHVNGGGDYSDYPQSYNPRYTQRQPRNHRGHNPRRRHNPPPHRSNSTLSLNNHGAVAIPPHYEVTVMSAPPDFQDFSPDFTTLTPMYPAAVSDFIMPYVANGYFPTPFTPPPGVLVEPEIGAVVVTSFGNDVVDAVRTQIEYYFSEINLTKDIYLRRNMNPEGYLQITLLQEFPRIRQLTKDYGTVLTAIQQSDALELNPDHTSVRTRLNPESWPLPTVCINNNNTPVESLNPNVPEFVPKMKVGS